MNEQQVASPTQSKMHLETLAQKVVSPTHPPVWSIQEVCSRHRVSMQKQEGKRLQHGGRNKMFYVDLAVDDSRFSSRDVFLPNIEVVSVVQGALYRLRSHRLL